MRSDSAGLRWGLRFYCAYNKLPGDATAAGPQATSEQPESI